MIQEHLFKSLLIKIPSLIDEQSDSVRVYKIRGEGEVTLYGVSVQIEPEEVMII